jgi:tRNA nucleotidyltransferase (CCA-adding enzyme)
MKCNDSEYGRPFIEDGHWTVIAERLYFTAAEMLADEIEISGIGREIDPRTMTILEHDAAISDTDPTLLSELLEPKHNWEL